LTGGWRERFIRKKIKKFEKKGGDRSGVTGKFRTKKKNDNEKGL